jgi:hypothetical protein
MSKTPAASVDIRSLTKKDTTISILIIGLLFFIFGFVSVGKCYPDTLF